MKVALLFLLFIPTLHAFNSQRCEKSNKGFFGKLLSTSQFTTSTGDCSPLNSSNEDKIRYYFKNNIGLLKIDAAKGRGEYLETLESMMNCKFSKRLKQDYHHVFTSGSNKSIYKNFLEFVHRNSLECHF